MYKSVEHEIKLKEDYLWCLKERRVRLQKELEQTHEQCIKLQMQINKLKGEVK